VTGRYVRTIAVAALLLAALLVVVAVAARAQLGAEEGSGGRDGPALPAGTFAYVYAGLLVLGVLALPFFFYVIARETPYSPSARRRARLLPFALVAAVAVGLFVASRWGDELRGALEQLGGFAGGVDGGPDATNAPRPPAPEWLPLVVVTATLAAAAGSVLAWRAVRRRRRRPSLAETLSDALDETLDDVAQEPDPRRAIILAYARMEAALDRSGCSRHEAEAPLEYLARVLGELDVEPGPVARLTELFERAKFSHHRIEPQLKADALRALEEIRAGLRDGP
jgi:hypothetical protein